MSAADAAALSALIRSRRSVRDFLPRPIPQELLDAVLEDARWAPSWSNTQPYRVAVASGALRDRLAAELCGLFDRGMAAQHGSALAKLKLLLTRKGLPEATSIPSSPTRTTCSRAATRPVAASTICWA